jgi:hypothetical protein
MAREKIFNGRLWKRVVKEKSRCVCKSTRQRYRKSFHLIPAAANYFAKKITKDHLPVIGSKRKTDMFCQ